MFARNQNNYTSADYLPHFEVLQTIFFLSLHNTYADT